MNINLISEVRKNLQDIEFLAHLLSVLSDSGYIKPACNELMYYRVMAVAKMLKSGMARNEVRDALMERFGVSYKTAYRLINKAMEK